MLFKYLESIRQQENPIDLTLSSIKTERDCIGSTGSHSPRSDLSLDVTSKSNTTEDEYLEIEAVDEEEDSLKKMKKPKYQAKRLLPCDTCGKKLKRIMSYMPVSCYSMLYDSMYTWLSGKPAS